MKKSQQTVIQQKHEMLPGMHIAKLTQNCKTNKFRSLYPPHGTNIVLYFLCFCRVYTMASLELETIPGEKNMEENTEQQQQQEQPAPVIPVNVSNVEGKENPGFDHEEQLESELTLPPMTFVDFLPLLIEEAVSNDDIPKYAEFR